MSLPPNRLPPMPRSLPAPLSCQRPIALAIPPTAIAAASRPPVTMLWRYFQVRLRSIQPPSGTTNFIGVPPRRRRNYESPQLVTLPDRQEQTNDDDGGSRVVSVVVAPRSKEIPCSPICSLPVSIAVV